VNDVKHLTEEQLSALLDGELKGDAVWRAEQHLESCEACRDALADLSARDATLGTALANEPGEEYFAKFADRVVGRIASAEAAGATSERAIRDAERRPFPRAWWESPRRLAMVGGVAMLVIGAGVVLLTAREGRFPSNAAEQKLAQHAAQTEAPPVVSPELQSPSNAPATPPPAAPSAKDEIAKQKEPRPPAAARSRQLPSELAANRMNKVPRGGGERRSAPTAGFAAAPKPLPQSATNAEKISALKRAAVSPLAAKSPARAQEQAAPPAAAMATRSLDKAARRDETGLRCGTVHDDQGRPLAGVEVTAIDVARSTKTTTDGRFCIDLPPGEHELQLLAVGFRAARLPVPAEDQGELAATLAPVEVLGGSGALARARSGRSEGAAAPAPATTALSSLSGGEDALRAFPGSLRAAAEDAAHLQADAAGAGGSAGYDAAAAAWEKVLARASGGAPEVEIRARIAECRYLGWRRAGDARHASAAVEALTAFIGRVPIGERQNLAARWLDQIRAR